jgi:predicted dinucleotide-binding enzyme
MTTAIIGVGNIGKSVARHLVDGGERVFLATRDESNATSPVAHDANGGLVRTLPDGQSSGFVVAGLLPAEAHFVKAFGTLGAESLTSQANRTRARCCSMPPMTTRLPPRVSGSSRQPGSTR